MTLDVDREYFKLALTNREDQLSLLCRFCFSAQLGSF